MKKLILLLMMWFATAGMMVHADSIHISGYVTDSTTGHAVAWYPVHIDIDSSSSGFTYHRELHTDSNGFYADTIVFNTGGSPTGIMWVWLYDCMQNVHSESFAFSPGHLTFDHNFLICAGTPPPPCHADFYPAPPIPLTVHFINTSVGSNGPWHWTFNDGTESNQFDPIHTFPYPGYYHVHLTMGDSAQSGCWDSITHLIQVGDSTQGCHAQFTWYIDTANVPTNTVHFINQSLPDTGHCNWDFGDGGTSTLWNPTYTFATVGIHHVCLTISTSFPDCHSTECHEIHIGPPPPPPCESWFTHMNDWLHVNFEGHIVQNLPATYNWTFGDGTAGTGKNSEHNYAAPGFYTVSLTTVRQDSSQCTFTSTQQIHVGDSNNIHQVYGQVFEGNFPLHFGMVMIFSNDTMPGGMPFFAMSPIDSMGIYMFPYVPNGHFVIWALPFDSAGGYLPTFYEHTLYWQQATVIELGNPQNPYNISLIHAGNMPAGQGGINGYVNTTGLKSASVDKIAMLLTDEQGNVIGFRKVNASGSFDFSGMAYGTYYLLPELPNTIADQVKVVLSAANPVATVVMTFNGSTINGLSETSAVESFIAYPNPVKDVLNLSLKLNSALNAEAEIYSFTGQIVSREALNLSKGANVVMLDISQLNSGLYTLRITSPEGIRITQKFVKE
ncbi:MAG: PKD domain-containing protein [Bacteroidetes bacterium]|nr:PKD domain-containing protein [Bacteroidota bacterium]